MMEGGEELKKGKYGVSKIDWKGGERTPLGCRFEWNSHGCDGSCIAACVHHLNYKASSIL